jgi:predicted unusual protein kinase regulating ubiquinone biosynthesis (AarF/ABC1/UbiB family)
MAQDFGMMGEIEPSIRRGLIRATLHLVNREFGALADDFITLGLLPPGSDRATIVPALTSVFQVSLATTPNLIQIETAPLVVSNHASNFCTRPHLRVPGVLGHHTKSYSN